MSDNDCPVCNGRKIILTRDYADCEREEPCSHCSEHEHCASCIALRAENARLREAVKAVRFWADREVVVGIEQPSLANDHDRWLAHQRAHVLSVAHKEVMTILDAALTPPEKEKESKS